MFRQACGQVDCVAYALSTNPRLFAAVPVEKVIHEKVIQLTQE